jgi:hypothetical protein
MTRTQILLPDELYERIKRLADEKEMSMTELARRALENWLERFPSQSDADWQLPVFDGGGINVPLTELREVVAEAEAQRSLSQ